MHLTALNNSKETVFHNNLKKTFKEPHLKILLQETNANFFDKELEDVLHLFLSFRQSRTSLHFPLQVDYHLREELIEKEWEYLQHFQLSSRDEYSKVMHKFYKGDTSVLKNPVFKLHLVYLHFLLEKFNKNIQEFSLQIKERMDTDFLQMCDNNYLNYKIILQNYFHLFVLILGLRDSSSSDNDNLQAEITKLNNKLDAFDAIKNSKLENNENVLCLQVSESLIKELLYYGQAGYDLYYKIIFVNKSIDENLQEACLLHELIHSRQIHSLDLNEFAHNQDQLKKWSSSNDSLFVEGITELLTQKILHNKVKGYVSYFPCLAALDTLIDFFHKDNHFVYFHALHSQNLTTFLKDLPISIHKGEDLFYFLTKAYQELEDNFQLKNSHSFFLDLDKEQGYVNKKNELIKSLSQNIKENNL